MWLNTEEAAKYLGISVSNIYSLAQRGRIPVSKIGKVWRFDSEELDVWVRANKPIEEFFTLNEAFIDGNLALRDPQREAYNAALDFFSSGGHSAIIQLPVGCGKSGVIAILPFGIAKGRVLVIAPNLTIRDELKKNLDVTNRRTCFWTKCDVLPVEALSAGPFIAVLDGKDANIHDCEQSHIVVTNIQQLASSADRWLPQFPDGFFDFILVDEGHHSAATSWKKAFDRFPEAKIVNLTATPFRSDNKDIEGELIYRYTFKRAMLKGYIKKLQAVYVAPEELYFSYDGDEKRHTREEVLQLKEEEWFSRGVAASPACNMHIVEASLEHLERLRLTGTHHQLIAVAMSVNHAREIRSLYNERGFQAEEIYSQMSEDKKSEVLKKLRSGNLDCIIQVQMLGEGFDHPHLSVAAIFRPFRTLSPYVQFVGRIMRVVVQNEPRHPDNYGYVVTHIGLNLDQQLSDFREMDREDMNFFQDLISGIEPEPPEQVINGSSKLKLTPDLIVNREIVAEFFEEDFLQPDDQALIDELAAQAESLGFDADQIRNAIAKQTKDNIRRVKASSPFPIQPQSQRREARKRLTEQSKNAAKILLNRVGLDFGGREMTYKYFPGLSGNNFVAAVQLVNKEVDKRLGIKSGQRHKLKIEDFEKGLGFLEDILNQMTRNIKGRMKNHE